uniref:Uncharacterized protein n=1 Tax=Arion vulgaris TaxID=1028688 RepID=A0A0B7B9W7_9EUPU
MHFLEVGMAYIPYGSLARYLILPVANLALQCQASGYAQMECQNHAKICRNQSFKPTKKSMTLCYNAVAVKQQNKREREA